MAGSSVIGALRVVLGIDSAALDKGLSDSSSKLQQFGSDITKAGAVIGLALSAAFGSVAVSINGVLDKMEGFAKQSQKIGIPVEQLSALSLAADISNISMEQLQGGLGKLSKAMVEAAAKPTSEAANAFRALGVQVTDSNGKLRPVLDVTTSIAGKFEGMKDGAGKTAVSMALLGKAGAELIPMLNMGSDGLKQMMDNAQKFGIVIDTKTAMAADKFRDSLKLLGAAKDGIIIKLTAYLLPAMQAFADRMLANATNADKQAQKLSFLKTIFDGFSTAVLLVVDNFGALLKLGAIFIAASIASAAISMVVAFVSLARAVQAAGLMMAAFEAIRALGTRGILILVGILTLATGQFEAMTNAVKDIAGKISDALPEGTAEAFSKVVKSLGFDLSSLSKELVTLGGASESTTKKQTDFNYAALAGKTAVDAYLDSTKKALAAQEAETATVGFAVGAKEKLRVQLQANQIAAANHIVVTDALKAKIDALGISAEQSALKLNGANLIQQSLPAWQQYTLAVQNAETSLKAIGATAEQKGLVLTKMAQDAGANWATQGANMAGSFKDVAEAFGKNNREMAIAAKAFGIVQAVINTYTAYTKALASLPPPFNFAAAAVALASGLAAVATIAAQPIPAFKTGGSIVVPGGQGGGDTKMFQAMVEPGERIDITPNSGRNQGSVRGGDAVTVRVVGKLFNRESIEEMISGINDALGDGHKLKIA